jgi:hypothetical protein
MNEGYPYLFCTHVMYGHIHFHIGINCEDNIVLSNIVGLSSVLAYNKKKIYF